jgi:small GTP-binding protein
VVVLLPDNRGADISLHGGAWVVKSALDLARDHGFDVVEPTSIPLPEEATDGQTPIEREVLAHLPLARTELAVRVLLAQTAAWDRLLKQIQDRAIESERLQKILDDRSMRYLLTPPRAAIVGAANVGKSTLANQLFAQERSITADLPGTTLDWVGEIANIDGLAVMLVDTPGMRETDDAIEKTAIERSQTEVKQADLVVLVLDVSMPLEREQSVLLAQYPHAIRVLNKSDRTAAWGSQRVDGLPTIATTGQGIADLRDAIVEHFGCQEMNLNRPRVWTDRQRAFLEGIQRSATDC